MVKSSVDKFVEIGKIKYLVKCHLICIFFTSNISYVRVEVVKSLGISYTFNFV